MHQASLPSLLAVSLAVLPSVRGTPTWPGVHLRDAPAPDAGTDDSPWKDIKSFLADPQLKSDAPDLLASLTDLLGPDPDANATDPFPTIDTSATSSYTMANGTVLSTSKTLGDYKPGENLTAADAPGAKDARKRSSGGAYPDPIRDGAFPSILSLGDSSSAAPGAGSGWPVPQPFEAKYANLGCVRTNPGWPVTLRNYLNTNRGSPGFEFNPCTGFNTTDIVQKSIEGPQANWLAHPPDPDLITLTMGGNNGQAFIGVVTGCVIGGSSSKGCQKAVDNADKVFDGIQDDLQKTLLAARNKDRTGARWPGVDYKVRTILLMGYPTPYEDGDDSGSRYCFVNKDRRKDINALATKLNTKLMQAAYNIGRASPYTNIVFIDPNNPDGQGAARPIPDNLNFAGNRYCNSQHPGKSFFSFLGFPQTKNPVSYVAGMFHPNADGNAAMAAAAQQALSLHFPPPGTPAP